MKKKVSVLLLAVLFVFGLAACGGGNASNPVADFLAEYGDELHEEFDMLMGGDGNVTLTAGTGNEMIFTFRFNETLDAENLELILDMLGSTFEFLAAEFQEEIELDSMRMTVRFYDADNNRAERSFDS